MGMSDEPDVLSFLRGLHKKHGTSAELVIKYRNAKGKVRRLSGRLIGLSDTEVGLHNAAWRGDRWFAIDQVVDAWKHKAD
jgi:hypothetical protein